MSATAVELTIDQEFEALLPPLSPVQLAQLETNLESEGWRKDQAIIVWANHDDIIVDGMNRYRICKRLGIAFKSIAKTFEDRDAVEEWIRTNAAGQRNMTADQEAANRGAIYNLRKKRHGGTGANRHTAEQSGQNVHSVKTAEEVAAQFGVDERTIRRDGKFAEALDKVADAAGTEVKKAILSGTVKANRSDVVALSNAPAKDQRAAIKSVQSGQSESLKEAMQSLGPTPHEEAKADPERRWCASLHKLYVFMTSTRDLGGIKKLTGKWTGETRKEYVEELKRIVGELNQWVKILEDA